MTGVDADVVVLGGGPAGIGVGLALGERALVLESERVAGGLAGSVELAGARFDLGGHSFHTPHHAVRELVFGALPMEEQKRNAWCFAGGEWLPYPFQKHFDRLSDAAIVAECRDGLAHADPTRSCAHFEEFLDARFGPGIARHFLRPYNRKLWGDDLSRLAADWTAERVAAPAGVAESFAVHGGQRRPLQDDTAIAYPASGGFDEIFRALAQRLPRLALGESAVAIDPAARSVTTSAGRVLRWRELASTLALPRLLSLLPDVPVPLRTAVARLEALPVTLVMIALDGRLATDRHRVYVPDPVVPGHKVVLNNTSSAWLRAQPRHGIQVEVSDAEVRRVGSDNLVARTVEGLVATGLLEKPERVTATRTLRLAYGYPVPTHERSLIVATACQWLGERGIVTLGRFGEWAYINSDEALHRGLQWGGARSATNDIQSCATT